MFGLFSDAEYHHAMLMTFHIRTFLPEAASAARVRPCQHKPVYDGTWSGNTTALAERRQR